MGIIYPDAGWTPPEGIQISVQDAYDSSAVTYWAAWLAVHGPKDPLYSRVFGVMAAHGVDIRSRYWSEDGRPCARIYAVTKAQIVTALKVIYPEYSHTDEATLTKSVEACVWWLYGRRKRSFDVIGDDGRHKTVRRMTDTDEGVFRRIEKGHGSGQGGAGVPSLYVLKLPGDMTARGAEQIAPDVAMAPAVEGAIDPAARGSWIGTPCLDQIIERHAQAAAGRGRSLRIPNKARLAQACADLLSDGWTWGDIDRAHAAYIAEWARTDTTPTGRWIKGLEDFLRSTTKDHRTPDTRRGIIGFLQPGRPWPELSGVVITGNRLQGWRWEAVDAEGRCCGGDVIAGSQGATTVEEAERAFAQWLYTTEEGSWYRTSVWEAATRAHAAAPKANAESALPRGIKLRRNGLGAWEWGVDVPGWRWRQVDDAINESKSQATKVLLRKFRTESGAKLLAKAQRTLNESFDNTFIEDVPY